MITFHGGRKGTVVLHAWENAEPLAAECEAIEVLALLFHMGPQDMASRSGLLFPDDYFILMKSLRNIT